MDKENHPHNPFDQGFYTSDELKTFGFKKVGEHVFIAKNCTITGLTNIEVGDHVRIDSGTTIVARSGPLKIGSYVHIAGGCYLNSSGHISLGDFVGISFGSALFSANDDYSGNYLTGPTIHQDFTNINRAPIVLGRHVVIGSGSVILPGVSIEEGTIVGSLSLVKESLAGWGMYLGIPAKFKKERSRALLNFEKMLMSENESCGQ